MNEYQSKNVAFISLLLLSAMDCHYDYLGRQYRRVNKSNTYVP